MRRVLTMMILMGCGARTTAPVASEASPGVAPIEQVVTDEQLVTDEQVPVEPATPDANSETALVTEAVVDPKAPSTDDSPDGTASSVMARSAELYAQCHDRLEFPESAGECSADADCTKAGCSQEICTTPAASAGMMSMCDMQPCFEVVNDCGCVEGRCTWSLKPAPKLHKLSLPR